MDYLIAYKNNKKIKIVLMIEEDFELFSKVSNTLSASFPD